MDNLLLKYKNKIVSIKKNQNKLVEFLEKSLVYKSTFGYKNPSEMILFEGTPLGEVKERKVKLPPLKYTPRFGTEKVDIMKFMQNFKENKFIVSIELHAEIDPATKKPTWDNGLYKWEFPKWIIVIKDKKGNIIKSETIHITS